MINYNDLPAMQKLDPNNYAGQINDLPGQMQSAWNLGLALPLPLANSYHNILLCGMGNAALGADLLAAYAADRSLVPLLVHRDYELPAWAHGEQTLVILLSHSGETEETLSVYTQALERGCSLLVVAGGGRLAQQAEDRKLPLWRLPVGLQPGQFSLFLLALLLAVFFRLGLLPDPAAELTEALTVMRAAQANLAPESPVAKNPAKRLAGQMIGRWVTVYAADILAPAARFWQHQMAVLANTWSQCVLLPEANHNALAGINHPENVLTQTIVIFLLSPSNHARSRLRLDMTRQVLMTQGINTDAVTARGAGLLAHIGSTALFGAYTAYYLALAYAEDPAQYELITMFKQAMSETQ